MEIDRSHSRPAGRMAIMLQEVETIISRDELADTALTGGLNSFESIVEAAGRDDWDYEAIDLSADKVAYHWLKKDYQEAFKGVFGTLFRAEAVVDDWMPRIVEAVPAGEEYSSLKQALAGQAREEAKHKASIARYGSEVLGLKGDLNEQARQYNNFVAETLFSRFNGQMERLLAGSDVPLDKLRQAIFIYGIISEDVVANSDVVIRRAKGGSLDSFGLPGMKAAQANVRKDEGRHVRIAHLSTLDYLKEDQRAKDAVLEISAEYLDLADKMLGYAKSRLTGGLIDHYLAKGYGPGVDSLYYYFVNMTRFARRLDKLGLPQGAAEIFRRMEQAKEKYTDSLSGEPKIRDPNRLALKYGPRMLGYVASAGMLKV